MSAEHLDSISSADDVHGIRDLARSVPITNTHSDQFACWVEAHCNDVSASCCLVGTGASAHVPLQNAATGCPRVFGLPPNPVRPIGHEPCVVGIADPR